MSASRLLIYEPRTGGHRPDFVRYVAEELSRLPYEGEIRFVLGRGFLNSEPELRALLNLLAPAVEVVDAPVPAEHPESLLEAISDFRPDCVLLFELTKWETFLCRHRLPCDLAGILFVQYPEIEWRKARGVECGIRFARRLVKDVKTKVWLHRQSVRAVFLLNGNRAARWLNARFPDRPVFQAIPDPAPTGPASGGEGSPAVVNSPVQFLFPGVLSRRKGLFRLIEALHRIAPSTAARSVFRFLGKVETGDREPIRRALARLWIRRPDIQAFLEDQAVPEAALRESMAEADWILMPYLRPEYSSGILARAAVAATPVMGPADGLLGRLIRENGLGRAVDLSPSALALALDEAAAHPILPDEEKRRAFLEQSRPDRFARSLLEAGLGGGGGG